MPWWIWQEKGGIPNVMADEFMIFGDPHLSHEATTAGAIPSISYKVGKMMVKHSGIYTKAATQISLAKDLFKLCMDVYGEDQPWKEIIRTNKVGDINFSSYFLTE